MYELNGTASVKSEIIIKHLKRTIICSYKNNDEVSVAADASMQLKLDNDKYALLEGRYTNSAYCFR